MSTKTEQSVVQSRLLSYSRRSRTMLALSIACSFGATVQVVAFAFVLSQVIARVFIEDRALDDVMPLMTVLVALSFGRAAMIWAGEVFSQHAASHLKDEIERDLLRLISMLGPAYTRGERSGELVHAVGQGVEELDEYIAVYQPLRVMAAVVPLLVAIVVLAIDPWTVLILLATGPLLVLFLALIGRRTGEITQRRFLELSWMSASFLDLLQGLATLKMFGRSREQVENIREISKRYSDTTMDVLRTAFETSLVLELSTSIATALVAVEISVRLIAGDVGFDRALAVLVITPEFFLPLRQLATKYHAGAAGKAAGERLFEILDTESPQEERGRARAGAISRPVGDIRFEGVSYSYTAERQPALTNLSLEIPMGQITALVGPSGAGKTTVASLLLRFMEPGAGRIVVGDAPLAEVDATAWRSQVAWVPQRPHLFHGTVAENIRLARADATDDEVIAAAAAASAHEFIQRLPLAYDTQIGERGARLSGGEQQRLAIARAFLKDAPLLILDEATSHLDPGHESMIRDALSRLMRGRTVLIVAHRLEFVLHADRVVVMGGGHVKEAGTPQVLLAEAGSSTRLVASYEGGGVA